MGMSRADALCKADQMLLALIEGGDEDVFAAATRGGLVDYAAMVGASLAARELLADEIMMDDLGAVGSADAKRLLLAQF